MGNLFYTANDDQQSQRSKVSQSTDKGDTNRGTFDSHRQLMSRDKARHMFDKQNGNSNSGTLSPVVIEIIEHNTDPTATDEPQI